MLNSIFLALYPKVFINIVIGMQKMSIYAEINSKNSVVDSEYRVFETTLLEKNVEKFIERFIEESPYFYISILDDSDYQGAVASCEESEIGKVCDLPTILSKCKNNWSYYTSKYELKKLQDRFSGIEFDFVFSPFSILSEFFKDKTDLKTTAFVLIEPRYVSFCIFDKSKLIFAKHLDLFGKRQKDQPSDKQDDLVLDGLDIESIDLDLDHNDFSDTLEELEIGEAIESLSLDEKHQDSDIDIDSDDVGEDYERFLLIKQALDEFYESKYSEFIETIYIANSLESAQNLKSYIEDELFLGVYVRKIDLALSVCDFAKAEVHAL
ncbi:MAG: hypothetical protein WC144_03380 [Sulfurimonas sp.]|jgi:hypothetical protein|nr:hypothetical protein [Sulfurimonadaceae bacterium]